MNYMSVCSGFGGAELAFEPLGWRCVAMSEIDASACAVLSAQYPNVPNLGDFTKIGVNDVEPIDLLVGGTPCQDFSVAGLRVGIEGERGNLTLEFIRLTDRLKPKYVVWENVPGILSLEEGRTIQKVIDMFTQIGYICDIDVHDAQEFGVPQRRRRVFVTCVRLEDLLKKKTNISDRIMLELLAQAWQSVWDAALPALYRAKSHLVSESQIEERAAFLQKKMDLLNALLGASAVTRLLDYWDDPQVLSTGGHLPLELTSLQSREQPIVGLKVDTGGSPNKEAKRECGYRSTAVLWENVLDVISGIQNPSTTSTLTAETMETSISSFAEALLTTLLFIVNSPTHSFQENWSSDYWNLASLLLTLTKEITAYAGSASCELFSIHSVRNSWGHCVQLSQSITDILERHIGNWTSSREILFIAEGLQRYPPPRREAGKGISGCLKGGSGERGWPDPSDGNGGGLVDVSGSIGGGSGERGWSNDLDNSGAFIPVAHTLGTRNTDGRNERGDGSGNLIPTSDWPAEVTSTLDSRYGKNYGQENQHIRGGQPYLSHAVIAHHAKGGDPTTDNYVVAYRTNAAGQVDPQDDQSAALTSNTDPCTQILAFDTTQVTSKTNRSNQQVGDPCHTLAKGAEPPLITYRIHGENSTAMTGDGIARVADPVDVVRSLDTCGGYATNQGGNVVKQSMQVRRLTPIETARLQGVPDEHCRVTYKGKVMADGNIYRMHGNGFCVPVVAWIGKRIQEVQDVLDSDKI